MDEQNQTPPEELNVPEENNSNIEGTVFKDKDSKVGPIIGSIIVIIIIIIGGIYMWSTQIESQKMENESMEEAENTDSIDEIEQELDSMNLDEIDAELEAIDAEFSS